MIGRQVTFGDLKLFHYGAILADPPWLFANRSTKGEGKNPNQHYPCMKTEDKAWSRCHREPPGPDRARRRSETYPGIAAAMAAQWGGMLPPTQIELFA